MRRAASIKARASGATGNPSISTGSGKWIVRSTTANPQVATLLR
ncbi:hypothetical protein C791_0332 [Amycolatopsis azurea DSM 43854]|uniref:Uncharacterized protein n=1 Tax=Amycolatopsis azurea DSM 43854 TaxID=1238180 RepID=M2NJ94_9PSEU|nr:hypothetical protein C791_0332 [Amycolatopsis azurea DSM 43854]